MYPPIGLGIRTHMHMHMYMHMYTHFVERTNSRLCIYMSQHRHLCVEGVYRVAGLRFPSCGVSAYPLDRSDGPYTKP